jgi:hypothetical protein
VKTLIFERAPEPSDVYWENMNVTTSQRLKNMAVTFIATLLLICTCASAVYGIKSLKTYVDDEEKGLPPYVTTLVSILCSIVIMSVNTNLRKVIRELTIKERHETYTAYNISVATKLTITRFFNSAIVPVLVNVYSGDWFKDGGLI